MSTSTRTVAKALALKKVIKRDGNIVDYDLSKVKNAALKALEFTGDGGEQAAQAVAKAVERDLKSIAKNAPNFIPHVEQIQDLVEKNLMLADHFHAAKHFILYRQTRTELRDSARMTQLQASENFKKIVEESKQYFKNPLSEFVYFTSYARWLEEKGRRETWVETVQRFMDFMKENLGDKLNAREYEDVHKSMLRQDVIPSMRLLWSSGDAARETNVAAYNCSFIAITELRDFAEAMYISMCGCGVGFSVEEKNVKQLPEIATQTGKKLPTHVVADSKEGWANAFLLGLETWFSGKDIEFDYSLVRPKGARLKTMGGRASGPQPLMDLMTFSREKILSKQGKKLSSIDAHDIACKVGDIVVAGGVRRSAMISISDLNDMDMRNAKKGQFWVTEPQRSMANNSVAYEEKPTSTEFLREWLSLAESGTGERGMFNRGEILNQLPERRRAKFADHVATCGTNPCGEIILRSRQFCNLTAIVARENDTEETLLEKIRIAGILGTYQATLTKFNYLNPDWKKNCEEEALLGVSFTGYYDNKVIQKSSVLSKLREEAVAVNKKYAKRFGIVQSTCVTCVKPSGNSSQLLDTSSGMHPRYSPYYIRRVRVSATDPIFAMLRDQGVPYHPEVGQDIATATTYVLEFPIKAPDNAVVKDDISAVELLEEWKKIKVSFTEHNPSATIYVASHEWAEVAHWVYSNWEIVGGLSFLPKSDHLYKLAPYEEVDKKTYELLLSKLGDIDFSKLVYYEMSDRTTGAKELACIAGACEI